MSATERHPVDDFVRGVEHGKSQWRYLEVQLRIELEGETRRRIRQAVNAEREKYAMRARWVVLAACVLTWLTVYNVTLNGVRWPW